MRKKNAFRVIHGNQKKKQRPVRKLIYLLLGGALCLFLLQAGFSFARDALASVLVRTVLGEEGILEQTITAGGILVRDEQVVAAPQTGTLRWLVEDGERLAKGAGVAALAAPDGSSGTVAMPGPGFAILSLDGLEGALQPQGLAEINLSEILTAPAKNIHTISGGEEVSQGTMLFKVVNNFNWFFAAELTTEEFTQLEGRTGVRMRFSFAPEVEIRGQLRVLYETDEYVGVAFELTDDVPGFAVERFADAQLVVSQTAGVIIPVSALVSRGEETGVYILEKSVVRFRTVEILDRDDENVVVSGVRKVVPVIINPTLVREGMRL